jgi:ribulose-phosphate 3-epimerase
MLVIPAINCIDLECVKDKIAKAVGFLEAGAWIHLDVADARFTFNKTWGNPEELKALLAESVPLKPEIHLMVEEPERTAPAWLEAGAKRLIVHLETMRDPSRVDILKEACRSRGAELMLAASPETPKEAFSLHGEKADAFQVLAVNPGFAGQGFQPFVLEKVRWLRDAFPSVPIEVDGGINAETARMAKEAGADMVVSASYLFDAPDPALAYSMLMAIN